METLKNKKGIAKVSEKGDFLAKLQNVKKLSKEQISSQITKKKGGKMKFKKDFLDNWKKEHGNESSSEQTVRGQIRRYIYDKIAIPLTQNCNEDYVNAEQTEKYCKELKIFFEKSLLDWKDTSAYPCHTGEKAKDKQEILMSCYSIFASAYDLQK